MKKNKILLGIAMVSMIPFVLTGCDWNTTKTASVSSDYTTSGSVGVEADSVSYNASYTAAEEAGSDAGSENGAVNGETKRIYSGSVNMETTAFSAAYQGILSVAEEDGAWLESDNSGTYGINSSRYADLTIRVPADQFYTLIEALGGIEDVTIVSKNVAAEDVSEEYYDTEGRLENAKVKLENLQELSKQAENVQDLIAIEDAISDVQYNIEYLQGQVNRYDSQINYSSIYVSLTEVNVMSGNEEGYGTRLLESFKSGFFKGVNMAGNAILWIAQNWLGILLIILLLLSGCLRLVRRRRRKQKQKLQGTESQTQDKREQL